MLQLGPCNGPFDFQYVVDDLFSLGPEHAKWFGRAWKNYLGDFAVRSGRLVGGERLTDAEYEERLRSARPPPSKPSTFGDHLEACGYLSLDRHGLKPGTQGSPVAAVAPTSTHDPCGVFAFGFDSGSVDDAQV